MASSTHELEHEDRTEEGSDVDHRETDNLLPQDQPYDQRRRGWDERRYRRIRQEGKNLVQVLGDQLAPIFNAHFKLLEKWHYYVIGALSCLGLIGFIVTAVIGFNTVK
ncbi:MAG: hypothetical protein M1820_009895 [Bogoriella megaspora]|nr:MAG: hypothetical protein M1820_009895 [Bogoriella megaspora]